LLKGSSSLSRDLPAELDGDLKSPFIYA